MVSNVVDVETEMALAAMNEKEAMAIFVDLKAAFPSVAHRFMRNSLTKLGAPEWLLTYFDRLYACNFSRLAMAGGDDIFVHMRGRDQAGMPAQPPSVRDSLIPLSAFVDQEHPERYG